MNPEIAARLASLRIEWFASEKGYTFFTRENCAAVGHGASLGSSGVMTDAGLACLMWREGRPYFAAHGNNEIAATEEQVEAVRRFSQDLKTALMP